MAYKPSMRRSGASLEMELNITPVMNLMVVLIIVGRPEEPGKPGVPERAQTTKPDTVKIGQIEWSEPVMTCYFTGTPAEPESLWTVTSYGKRRRK